MSSPPSTTGRSGQPLAWWRGIVVGVAVLMSLAPGWALVEDLASDPPAGSGQQADAPPPATDPPPPTSTPSPVPSPTPPPSTSTLPPPSPTATLAPTSTQSPTPTATHPATEAPNPAGSTLAPTGEPVLVPTEQVAGALPGTPLTDPTATPSPSPTPSPTPEPAIPFEPVLTCDSAEGGVRLVAGTGAWFLQECVVRWATRNVSSVEVNAWTGAAGWRVIAVDANAVNHPEVLDASDGALNLSDDTLEDVGFLGGRLYLGTQLGCASPVAATVHLDLIATSATPSSGNEEATTITETHRTDLALEGTAATTPMVTLEEIAFTSVEPVAGKRASDGAIRIAYSGASACEWRLEVTLGDFVEAGGHTVPASNLTNAAVTGVPGATIAGEAGHYTIAMPVGPAAGELTMTISLDLPGALIPGRYTTTVVATAITDT